MVYRMIAQVDTGLLAMVQDKSALQLCVSDVPPDSNYWKAAQFASAQRAHKQTTGPLGVRITMGPPPGMGMKN